MRGLIYFSPSRAVQWESTSLKIGSITQPETSKIVTICTVGTAKEKTTLEYNDFLCAILHIRLLALDG